MDGQRVRQVERRRWTGHGETTDWGKPAAVVAVSMALLCVGLGTPTTVHAQGALDPAKGPEALATPQVQPTINEDDGGAIQVPAQEAPRVDLQDLPRSADTAREGLGLQADRYGGAGEIDPASKQEWWSTGRALREGERITIVATRQSGDLDGWLALFDPSGREVAFDDDNAGNRNPRIEHTATQGGNYTIRVSSWMWRSTGRYQLTIEIEQSAGSIIAGAPPGCALDRDRLNSIPVHPIRGANLGVSRATYDLLCNEVDPLNVVFHGSAWSGGADVGGAASILRDGGWQATYGSPQWVVVADFERDERYWVLFREQLAHSTEGTRRFHVRLFPVTEALTTPRRTMLGQITAGSVHYDDDTHHPVEHSWYLAPWTLRASVMGHDSIVGGTPTWVDYGNAGYYGGFHHDGQGLDIHVR